MCTARLAGRIRPQINIEIEVVNRELLFSRINLFQTIDEFEELNVKTPEMARKALAMAMIGCNLIKSVSQEAADLADESIRHISFKGALDEITSNSPNFRNRTAQPIKCKELYKDLLGLVADKLLDIRPFRYEPRAIKKRPKPFPRLIISRAKWKVDIAA